VGQSKAEAAKNRVLDINPEIDVTVRECFFGPDTADTFDFSEYSYVVDAIDTVTGKLALVQAAQAANVPILCSMGTGNKLDPTKFQIADITKTSVCPLARIMRKECAKRGIKHLKVLFSTEDPLSPGLPDTEELPEGRRALPGSVAFVPSVAGLIIAGEVIKDLVK
jgi:tRNA A37 threonylcarbamoyladenosine dehydratase